MGIIFFNGQSCQDYGVWVEHPPRYTYPKRNYTVTHIPGRNGDIVFDDNSYDNVSGSYDLAVAALNPGETFSSVSRKLVEWLHTAKTYARLEDTYFPEIYRMAYYEEEGDIENILDIAGRITVKFNCKPQKYLKSGETTIKISSTRTNINNPTKNNAKPIIKVNGYGSCVIGINSTYTISISSIDTGMYINSEIMDCYKGGLNKNSLVTMNNGFPELVPGNNEISFSGGIISLEITPNWWII